MTSALCNKNSFGFVILCPERNVGGLRNTVASIKYHYPGSPSLCVVGNDASQEIINELKQFTPTFQGQNTITSLINMGMHATRADWNVITFAGSWLRPNIFRKFSLFAKNKKDILFPVVDRKIGFVDGTLNGVILHKETFQSVGDFGTSAKKYPGQNDLELIKLYWSLNALDNGCVFKAIIGMRIC